MVLQFSGKASFHLTMHRLSLLSPVYDGGRAESTSFSLGLTLAGPGAYLAAILEQGL